VFESKRSKRTAKWGKQLDPVRLYSILTYMVLVTLIGERRSGDMETYPVLTRRPLQPELKFADRSRTCPFCGGLVVQLSRLSRCVKCLFEFCDECGGVDSIED
jgi:hypothetical protein